MENHGYLEEIAFNLELVIKTYLPQIEADPRSWVLKSPSVRSLLLMLDEISLTIHDDLESNRGFKGTEAFLAEEVSFLCQMGNGNFYERILPRRRAIDFPKKDYPLLEHCSLIDFIIYAEAYRQFEYFIYIAKLIDDLIYYPFKDRDVLVQFYQDGLF